MSYIYTYSMISVQRVQSSKVILLIQKIDVQKKKTSVSCKKVKSAKLFLVKTICRAAKRSIIEVRENVCFACTEEVIPPPTRYVANQMNTADWYMHSLYHLGPVLVSLTREPSTLRRRVSDTGSRVIQQTGLDYKKLKNVSCECDRVNG